MPDDNFDTNPERRERSSRWAQGGRGEPRRSGDGERSSRWGRGDQPSAERHDRRTDDRRSDRGFAGGRGERGDFRRDDRGEGRTYGGSRGGRDDRRRNDDRREGGRRDDERGGYRGDRRDDRGGDRRFDDSRRREDNRGREGFGGRDERRFDGGRRDERGSGGERRFSGSREDDRGYRGERRDERGGDRRFGERRDDRGHGGQRRDDRGGDRRFSDSRGRDDNRGRGGFSGRAERGAGWSDEQASIRGPRSWDAKASGDERPRRKPEPVLPEDITGYELDKAVRQQLRTLSKENADGVAKHLVAAAELLDEDPEKALDHAQHAVSRAGRVPAAREALGLVLYRTGEYAEALREFRTARRLSGSDHLLPYMVDCERGLGRYERALELANSPEAQRLSEADNIELAIVVSGIRRDMGQSRAAVVGLRIPALKKATTQPWAARLFYAYADALLDLGEREEARAWFVKADAADRDGETDAADRIDQLDGFELTDLTPEDEQDVDPRLAELDLSAFGAVQPAPGEVAPSDGSDAGPQEPGHRG